MTFDPAKTNEFIDVFTRAKPLIEAFDGCQKVELLRDTDQPNIFFTMSFWINSEALDKYRDSDLFNSTWDKAKKLFSDRPEAWSIEKIF